MDKGWSITNVRKLSQVCFQCSLPSVVVADCCSRQHIPGRVSSATIRPDPALCRKGIAFLGPALCMLGCAALTPGPSGVTQLLTAIIVALLSTSFALGAWSRAGLYCNHQDLSPKVLADSLLSAPGLALS